MAKYETLPVDKVVVGTSGANESASSAVSWTAIIAGSAVALATTLALMILGSAFGFASVSPWPGSGTSAAAIGIGAAIWFVLMQWISSGLGGYLTGRLRTKWVGIRTDEVLFRDTAHGFLAWATSTAIVFALGAMVAGAAVGAGVNAVATVGSGVAQGAAQGAAQGLAQNAGATDITAYFTDTLFRAPATAAAGGAPAAGGAAAATPRDTRPEAARILVRGLAQEEFPAADRAYLAQLVATNTGMTQAEAQQRVDQVIAQARTAETEARQAADTARKASATAAGLAFVALLIGAFIAAAAAALGGRQRDDLEVAI